MNVYLMLNPIRSLLGLAPKPNAGRSIKKPEADLLAFIRETPGERLYRAELALAKALVQKGYLKEIDADRYLLTEAGMVVFRAFKRG